MLRSRRRSWHLERGMSVKEVKAMVEWEWEKDGWVPVINTTVDGEDIMI